MKKLSIKYLYVVINWGEEPVVFRTKIALVNHFKKNNSRIVDGWFEKNWFVMIDSSIVIRVEIPKVKSKVRNK